MILREATINYKGYVGYVLIKQVKIIYFIGKCLSDEHKQKIKKNHAHISGKNHYNWKGGLPLRTHVLLERDCTKLNSRFKGSEFHHITKSIGIYIPRDIHKSVYHNMKNGHNMNEINKLALQYLKGGLQ